MGHGLVPSVIFGLIIHALIKCHPRAQFLGGGRRNFQAEDSYSQGVNVGNLGLSSTLGNNRGYSNGQPTGGVSHDLGVGPVGVGTSLSTSNLRNGIGLRQNNDGGVGVGLGPLGFDLHRNRGVLAQSGAGATGQFTNAQSQAGSRGFGLGPLGLSSAYSNSRANGYNPGYFLRRKRSAANLDSPSKPEGTHSDKKLDFSDLQEKLNALWPAVKTDVEGKNILSMYNENGKSTEELTEAGGGGGGGGGDDATEQRSIDSIVDILLRTIVPSFYYGASQFIVPGGTQVGVSQPQGISPVTCCTTCYGGTTCVPSIPANYPGGVNMIPSPQQGNGISYSSSSSSSSVGSGGPLTLYSGSNSQSGVQLG